MAARTIFKRLLCDAVRAWWPPRRADRGTLRFPVLFEDGCVLGGVVHAEFPFVGEGEGPGEAAEMLKPLLDMSLVRGESNKQELGY